MASGFYVGLGVVNQPVLTVGFTPDVVMIKSTASQISVCRTSSMSGSKELGAATALQSNRVVSFDPLGFTVGTHASVNALASIYHWVAFQSAPGELVLSSYTGNGVDDRTITGLGFEPEYMIVLPAAGQHAVQRFADQADDASFKFDASAASSNGIQSFLPDGFELGASAEVNTSGAAYHYLAWRRSSSAVDAGSYTGNATDSRSISTPGFQPGWVLVHGSSTNPVHRPSSLLGDSTLPFPASASFANGIQSLAATGFQIGTHTSVNEGGTAYYYAAFADNPNGHSDLSLALDADDESVTEGQTVQMTATLDNNGPASATASVVDFQLPEGLTYVQSSGDGSYAPATGIWTVPSIANGDAAVLVLDATVDPGTMGAELPLEAALTASDQGDPTSEDRSDELTLLVQGIDLAVALESSAETSAPGDTVAFSVTLSNISEGIATGIVLQDELPLGMTYLSHQASTGSFDAGSGEWSLSMDPEDEATLILQGRVNPGTQGQTLTSTAMLLESDQSDPVSANNEASAIVYIAAADLEIEKITDTEEPIPGQPVNFTITTTNHGPDAATGVVIQDILPEGLTFVLAVPSAGSYSAATGLWQLSSLAVDGSAQLLLTALVDVVPEEGVIANTAERISSSPFDPNPDNDADTAVIASGTSDVELEISASDLFPTEGEIVELEITVHNHGPAPTLGATVTTDFDPGIEIVSSEATSGAYLVNTWVVPSLPVDATEVLTIQARLAQGTGGTQQTAAASVILDLPFVDPISQNNQDFVTLSVADPPSADLRIEVVANEPAPRSGDLVEISIVASNDGPSLATGVAVSLDIDNDVTHVSNESSQGSYSEASGVWTIGSLASGAEEELVLTRSVGTGAIGRNPRVEASIGGNDPPDPNPGNDTSFAELHVAAANLALDLSSDDADPSRGDTIHLFVQVENSGPDSGTDAAVSISLPPGVTFQSSSASQGNYNSASKIWSIGSIAAFQEESLDLTVAIGSGAAASSSVTASVIEADPDDPSHGDWSDTELLHVHGVELEVVVTADNPSPNPGEIVEFLVTLANEGDGAATGVAVDLDHSLELSLELAVPHAGSFDDANLRWNVAALAAGSEATLAVRARVADSSGGSVLFGRAFVSALDQADGDLLNNDSTEEVEIPLLLEARALSMPSEALLPGGDAAGLLSFEIENPSTQSALVRSIAVSNHTEGPGQVAQIDANVTGLRLLQNSDGEWNELRSANLADSRATFGNLNLILPPASIVVLRVDGSASLHARDGDVVGLAIDEEADFSAESPARVVSSFPIDSGSRRPIDGMSAAQIELVSVGSTIVAPGAQEVPLLGVVLPANGYDSDELERLLLTQTGSGADLVDLGALELWIDDGDRIFDGSRDVRAGSFAKQESVWVWEVDPIAIPTAGLPIFVTADITANAATGRSLRLAIPLGEPHSIVMASANDGPVDASLSSPDSLVVDGVTETETVTWSALPLLSNVVHPGEQDAVLLRLQANDSAEATLTRLAAELTNLGSGSVELALSEIRLSWDVDSNGLLTEEDQAIAEATGSQPVFDGMHWTLPDEGAMDFLVTADVSLTALADGDQLLASIASPDEISMEGAIAEIASGSWPLQSGICRVNGMVAAQAEAPQHQLITIGPGAGPARVLELLVPRNGPLDDTLEQLRFVSLGNATASDFAELRLYRDGGDGAFPSNDDLDLGPLAPIQSGWSSQTLSEPLASGGGRFFVGVIASAAPSDSSAVQLAVPLNGITVQSDNDGPIDLPITGASGVRIVARGLIAAALPERSRILVGSDLEVTLDIENPSLEAVLLTELGVEVEGDGSLETISAPSPNGIVIPPSGSTELLFVYRATGAGVVQVSAVAVGVGSSSSIDYQTFEAPPAPVSILEPADRLVLSMDEPQSVEARRGDDDVLLWDIELTHPGTANQSSVLLNQLRLRVEDEDGAAISSPGELLAEIRVTSGQGVHASFSPMEPVLSVELDPLRIDPGHSIDLRIAVDIAAEAPLTTLRLVVDDAGGMTAHESVEARPVAIDASAHGYPLRSDLLVLFEAATELIVRGTAPSTVRTLRGSEEVRLAQLELVNPGEGAMSSTIELERIALSLVSGEDASRFFDRLRVMHTEVVLADVVVFDQQGENLVIHFDTPVTVPANSTVSLTLVADVREDAAFGSVVARFLDADLFLARDRQTREVIPVRLEEGGFSGNVIRVERPVEQLSLDVAARLPATLLVGARNVAALQATFHHSGDSITSRAQLQSLDLECRDAQFAHLVPSTYLDAVRAFAGEQLVGEVRELPEQSEPIRIELENLLLEPGSSATLEVRLDFAAGAPIGTFQVVGESANLIARDTNHLRSVPVEPVVPGEPALFSGLTRLQEPPRRLLVRLSSELPRIIVAGDVAFLAGTLHLTNPAEESAGAISLTSLELEVANRDFAPVAVSLLDRIYFEQGEDEFETVFSSQESAQAILSFAQPHEIAAGESLDLPFVVVPGSAQGVESLRFGVTGAGIHVVQPAGALFQVSVDPEEGMFPLWTDAAQLGASDLRSSFSNFPNPFSGGREQTTFVWFQPSPGDVTLRLWTLLGDRVVTLFDGELGGGLHQEIRWDGRNGRGDVVANGSYLVELTVGFEDGTEQRIRRKVAVAR